MNGLRLFAAFERLDIDVLRVRHRTGYKYGGIYTGSVPFTPAGRVEVVANAPSFGQKEAYFWGPLGKKKRLFLAKDGRRYRKKHQP